MVCKFGLIECLAVPRAEGLEHRLTCEAATVATVYGKGRDGFSCAPGRIGIYEGRHWPVLGLMVLLSRERESGRRDLSSRRPSRWGRWWGRALGGFTANVSVENGFKIKPPAANLHAFGAFTL